MSNFPIYIMHYSPNSKRKELLSKILDKEIALANFGGRCEWILDFDKENVSYLDYYNNFSANHLTHQNRQPTEYFPRYPLQPEVLSLCLKHKLAISTFLKESSSEYCLFLEDDAILHEEFFSKLDKYMQSIPKNFDAAFIGQGCGKRIPENELVEGKYWYKKEYPADRNTDSIIFSRNFLKVLLDNLNYHKISFPIDHEYSFWFRVLNSNVYWLEPSIVTQGSQVGLFDSFQPEHSRFIDKSLYIRKDLGDLLK